MEAGWVDFLRAPADGGHAVQVYAQLDELAESVAAYLATGFAAGEPAVVIATRDHQETFDRFLAGAGWDAEVLGDADLLVTLDANDPGPPSSAWSAARSTPWPSGSPAGTSVPSARWSTS
jgi:hypothetical protein